MEFDCGRIVIEEKFRTRDNATYSCPCEKTGFDKLTPILDKVCPFDLFIVIANAGLIENCLLLKVKGSPESDGIISILGNITEFPAQVPFNTVASITLVPRIVIDSLVPFKRPCFICNGDVSRMRV